MSNNNVTTFRNLHTTNPPLRLPNVWDAGSARLIESLGASAVATTSAGVAWTLGYRDGRALPLDEVLAAASHIVRAVKVPLSVDIEHGYSDDPKVVAATVQYLADLGVAGINIEDGPDAPQVLARKIEAIRGALASTRSDLFVNARTDVILAGLVDPAQQVRETIERGRQYAAAGADGLFVPGLRRPEDIQTVVAGVALPLNVMAWGGLPDAAALARLGVRRLSAGSAIPQAAWRTVESLARGFLETGDSAPLFADAKGFGEVQQLFPNA